MQRQSKKYHLIVVGAGSGGLVAAAGAAGLGVKVALIEKHRMGGDCLNTGCVPSKAIIRSAKLAHDAATAERFGFASHRFDIRLDHVLASVRDVQKKIAPHDSVERFAALGVDVRLGAYTFIAPHQISNGQEILEAKRFVIATGAAPFVPPIPGLSDISYLTSENVWDLPTLPKRLIVLGGGPIGAELAQAFARLGAAVTIVEMGDRLLGREDPEVGALLQHRFTAEGIRVRLQTKATGVSKGAAGFDLMTTDAHGASESLACDQILVAVGRAPNVHGLGLEKAGVAYNNTGLTVDAMLRTTARQIYACGDVVGAYQFTHTADFQARLILRNALFPGKSNIDYTHVPWCTFTDPEVARVGWNEAEARRHNVAVDTFTYAMSDLDRAVCDREVEGFIKVLTRKGTDRLAGVTLVGSHAGDLLHELALAMRQNIGLKKIATMIHVYPTLAEISKRIADTYQRGRLTPRAKRWLCRYFRWRFG